MKYPYRFVGTHGVTQNPQVSGVGLYLYLYGYRFCRYGSRLDLANLYHTRVPPYSCCSVSPSHTMPSLISPCPHHTLLSFCASLISLCPCCATSSHYLTPHTISCTLCAISHGLSLSAPSLLPPPLSHCLPHHAISLSASHSHHLPHPAILWSLSQHNHEKHLQDILLQEDSDKLLDLDTLCQNGPPKSGH